MDLSQLIQDVRTIVVTIKDGNLFSAMLLILKLVSEIAKQIPPPTVGKIRMNAVRSSVYGSNSVDELCVDLEACCTQTTEATATVDLGKPHPLIDKLLPILLALLTKFIGL